MPVILTGDFNFTPDFRAFQILKYPHIHILSRIDNQGNQIIQEYFQMDPIDFGIGCASSYQNRWITVDYISRSRPKREGKSIFVNRVYKLPSIKQCWSNGKIPNKHLGSDHFLLPIVFSVL